MTSTEEIVDTYEEQKSEWIQQHGSDFLKETIESGYFSNDRYAQERADVEYPGFQLTSFETFQGTFKETDSPPDFCFEACKTIEGAVCRHQGNSHKTYFAVIDDYLGSYQIAKKIEVPEVTNEVRSSTVIDVDKDNWISQYGSELLKEMLNSGYKSNTQYAIERLAIDYPGFELIDDRDIKRVDTPPNYCLEACRSIEVSYCGQYKYISSKYYMTIDNYLGKYQIAKEIKHPEACPSSKDDREIANSQSLDELFGLDRKILDEKVVGESIEAKNDWIFLNGSDLLQKSTLAGYDVKKRYLEERIQLEYPGFIDVTDLDFVKTDSPSKKHLKICDRIEGSYCAYNYLNRAYYITIHNYLGDRTIAKKIELNPILSHKAIKYSTFLGIFSVIGIMLFNSLTEFEHPRTYNPLLEQTIPAPAPNK